MRNCSALLYPFIVLFSLPLRATTLDDVRRALSELRGASPISVRLTAVDQRSDRGKQKAESRGSSVAEDDGTYIRLLHEKKDLVRKSEKKRGADHSVGAAEAADLMNYAPALLKIMEGATLKRAVQTSLNGKAATLLEIVPVREEDEDGDKWIKNYVDTLSLWVDGSGIPLMAKRHRELKARIVLIGFEIKDKDDLQFVRAGDRLVVTKRTTESSGSGLGQTEAGTKSIAVSINGRI